MQRASGLSFTEIMQQLNRHSGLKGISGLSNDMRTLLEAEAAGNAQAKLAIDILPFAWPAILPRFRPACRAWMPWFYGRHWRERQRRTPAYS